MGGTRKRKRWNRGAWSGRALTIVVLTAGLAPAGLHGQERAVGRWEGSLQMAGQRMQIAVTLRQTEGGPAGTMDIQGAQNLPLQNVEIEEGHVRFELDVTDVIAVFAGDVHGDSISGSFMQADPGTFVLERVRPMELDGPIRALMADLNIPGVAAAAIRDGEIVWTGMYGFADVENRTPVTPQTLFFLASVSKTVTATALMQLYADGRFGLDDDVSDYLPFEVRNPAYPDDPITFRQLLRHRSSVRDNMAFYGPYWGTARGDQDVALGDYLTAYLSEGGEHYDAEANFWQEAPNSEFHYCNTCYALIGYLAESISGQSFQNFTTTRLFEPLGMDETGWFYADVDLDFMARGYRHDTDDGFVPYGQVGYPDWPAGQLKSSVVELARFVAAYSQYGRWEGEAVMDSTTVEILSPRDATLGYHTWFSSSLTSTDDLLYSHGGGDLGARTLIAFDPETRNGLVVLTNGESSVAEIAALVYEAIPTLGWPDG